MKKNSQKYLSQQGFSLLTGFIVVIILFGSVAFFLAGQGINSGFSSKYTNQAKASALITSAGYITTGFDAVTLSGQTPSSVTFDTTTATGVFDPSSGGATLQSIDPDLLARQTTNLDGIWIYRGNAITMKQVGTSAADYTIMVSGLKKAICQQINYALHGVSLATNPTSLNVVDGGVTGTIAVSNGILGTGTGATLDISALVGAGAGWTSGCYSTNTPVGTDVNYVYIHTVLAQ